MSDAYPQLHDAERPTLERFLDSYRIGVLERFSALDESAASARLLPRTEMTIGGIVKHLGHMEDHWFTHVLLGSPLPAPWHGDDENWAFRSAGSDSVAEIAGLYEAACARSRAAVARFDDLDVRAARVSFGKTSVSLRWMLVHMLRETAQHAGHLDLMYDALG